MTNSRHPVADKLITKNSMSVRWSLTFNACWLYIVPGQYRN